MYFTNSFNLKLQNFFCASTIFRPKLFKTYTVLIMLVLPQAAHSAIHQLHERPV